MSNDRLLPTPEEFTNSLQRNVFGNSGDTLDPSNARLAASKLSKGGGRTRVNEDLNIRFQDATSAAGPIDLADDWKVRISLAEKSDILYKNNPGILAPLQPTNGVVLPYNPAITVSYNTGYNTAKPTHSNYAQHFYETSEVAAINITAQFTVQNVIEGRYLLAAIYFFRAAGKMFFGNSQNAGNPPPILFLNGYGKYYFPNVPCVLTVFQHTLDQNVDYVEIPVEQSGQNLLPTPGEFTDSVQRNIFGSQGTALTGVDRSDSLLPSPGEFTSSLSRNVFSGKANQLPSGTAGGPATVRLPTLSNLVITLQPVYSRKRVSEFNHQEFANGNMLKGFI